MSKYIKVFDTVEEYNAYSGGTAFTSPNISYIKSTDETKYDDNEIKHYTEKSWVEIIPQEDVTATTLADFKQYIKSIEIPSGVTSFSDEYFKNAYNLETVKLPNSVSSLSNLLFYNCYKLSNITIPNTVTSIGNSAFSFCKSLKSIEIPNSVTTLGFSAFHTCSAMTDVTIGNSVTSIGSQTFYECYSLSSLTIGNSVTSIGNSSFAQCAISTLTIPDSVTTIGYNAFEYCDNLTSVTIGSGITSIASSAIKQRIGVYNLKTITCYAVNPPTIANNSLPLNTVQTVYVPSGSVEAYKAATNWGAYPNIIQPIPNN